MGKKREPVVPRERSIEAAPGLRVSLRGGYSGEIAAVQETNVKVLLDEGTVLNVNFGDDVTVEGRTAPLEAPRPESERVVGALKAWRLERSRSDEVPAFVILHDATLEELAERGPRTLIELASISGIGPAKIENYGTELLTILDRERS